MGTLEGKMVHVVLFSHLQEDYEKELISIYSLESQSGCPQTNFQKFNETTSELFDEQEDAHSMVVTFEDVQ